MRVGWVALAVLVASTISATSAGADGLQIQSAEVDGSRVRLRLRNETAVELSHRLPLDARHSPAAAGR